MFTSQDISDLEDARDAIDRAMSRYPENSDEWNRLNALWCSIDTLIREIGE